MDWGKIWDDIVTFFKTNAWNIVIFFAVLFIGIIIVKLLVNVIRKILKKTKMEPIAVGFTCGIIKVLLYLVLVLALLSIIGIELTGILTTLSAIFLAVGLALQNIIANVANGIVLVSAKMFKKGDYIKIGSEEGNVIKINFLFTTILTGDNKRITIPNSTIVNGNVIDYDSAKTRRVDIKFSVAYESDVEKVKKIIKDVMYSNGKVLLNPEPFCRLNAFDQIEIRERKDHPVLPVVGKGLPKRVEKVRAENHTIDLENMSFGDIFKGHKKKKSNKFVDKIKKKNATVKNTNKYALNKTIRNGSLKAAK